MQNVSGVGCNTVEELIIRGAEQVGDGWQIIVAVAKPLAATYQGVETQYRGARSGSPEPTLTDYWAHSCSQQAYYAPVNHVRSSPRNPCT